MYLHNAIQYATLFIHKGGDRMATVGQTYRKKQPSGMSREAKDKHNAYQREWNKENPKKKREINKRYWEKKAR